ncbi:MAG: sulfite exporter TauE/SafE family protein, partial [Gemmatimonadetes bacterium]|nr:sulfite exporter TauE/SafE family protein [Gemmatimonadota bacterium]
PQVTDVLSNPWAIPLFLLAGVAAGFINTVAGGGSLITYPLLIFAGFPPHVANGTIRVTILLQNLVAVPTYAKHGHFYPKQALLCALVAVPASIAGAVTAVRMDPDPFRAVSAVLLLVVLATLFLKPSTWMRRETEANIRWARMLPLLAVVAFYGGFFQLGAGMPFLAVAVLAGGWDLVSANSLKVTVILLFIIASLFVFAGAGHVNWTVGIVMGVGNALGAWLGARAAVKRGPAWIRWVIVVMGVAAAGKMIADTVG